MTARKVDLYPDGDIDLLATNQDANTITWYENDGLGSPTSLSV